MKEASEDQMKLLEMVRKLNARAEYARLAQIMLCEILPRINSTEFSAHLKRKGKLQEFKDVMETYEIYGAKHYARLDRNLKSSYFVQYMLGQAFILADKARGEAERSQEPNTKTEPKRTAKARRKTENLFTEQS